MSAITKEEIDQQVQDPEILNILNSQPDLEQDIVRVPTTTEGEQNRSQLCEDLGIEGKTCAPFVAEEAIRLFIDADLLKNCTLYDQYTINKQYMVLEDEKIAKTLEILFWMVNLMKFEPERLSTLNELRRNIGFLYSKMFEHIPQPKEEIFTLLQFVYGYLVHAYHYKLLPNERKIFNIRFVLDCYHIVIYVMTGVLVTDYFIHNHIEKQYQDNFFQYQHDSGPIKVDFNVNHNSVFQATMGITKEDFDKLKSSETLTHEDVSDTLALSKQLSARFAKLNKIMNSKSGLLFNRLQNEMMHGLIDISRKEDCESILNSRYAAKQLSLTKIQENQSGIGSNNPNRLSGNSETDMYYKRHNALPSINKKFKFDCAQISPGMQTQLSKGIANVNNKKTIGFSSFQIPQFNINDLSEIYHKYYKRLGGVRDAKPEKKLSKPQMTKKQNDILRYAQSKVDDMEKYKHLNQPMKKKFSEFFAVKNILDQVGQVKFIDNDRYDQSKRLVQNNYVSDNSSKFTAYKALLEEEEHKRLEILEKEIADREKAELEDADKIPRFNFKNVILGITTGSGITISNLFF